MILFAGTFCLKQEREHIPTLDYDIIRIDQKNYFIMGGSEDFSGIKEIIIMLEKAFGALDSHDISIEGESRLEILGEDYEEDGAYECVTFEGPQVDFDDIIARFADSGDVLTVREIGVSKNYATPIIRVDFLY